MRALITNDDGIDSPGLESLTHAAVSCGLDVVVAAPALEASGTSASIAAVSEDGRVLSERRSFGVDVPAYAVAAHPGLISLIACRGGFGGGFDLVLSGVNRGANVGRAILHSGTVGAALTAGVHDLPALAVSLDVGLDGPEPLWDKASDVVLQVLPFVLETPGVFSLNVPKGEVRGLEWASLARFGSVQSRIDEVDENTVELAVMYSEDTPDPGTDAALLASGRATLTALAPVSAVTVERPLPVWPAR